MTPAGPFELATASRIVFGAGRIRELPGIIAGRRTLLVTGRRGSPIAIEAAHHVRVDGEPTIDDARRAAAFADVEIVVAIGGGSALDLGKAAAALIANGGDALRYLEIVGEGQPLARPSLPFIAVPTTAGTGSEVTRNAVLGSPEHGVKASLRSPHMLPAVALVDPDLTWDLPPALTASTGLDALTQLIEPFVSARANAFVDAICRDAIPRVIAALPRAYAGARAARADMSYAGLCSGLALANAGLGAVHGLAGPIGGRFPAPHGAVCAVLLPHVAAMNAARTADPKFAELAAMTGDLAGFVAQFDLPPLSAYGLTFADVPAVVAQARQASSMKANPVALSDADLAEVLTRAL
ncbi:MAG: iron-containing alcohol dehydrogenase [Vicinamibacteraceae bacterium]